ncbi:MAG: hypothetical protein NT133_26735, partial [Alphaproteobacteria bacterium]|nr:hypothetical protein [Alphaproteobacteria bacterium]
LEVFAGGRRLGTCGAGERRADLAVAGIGDHGFRFRPPHRLSPAERDVLHFRAEGSAEGLFDAFGAVQPNPFLGLPPPTPERPRFRRCILHIGTEKTGTTSLQRFLALNRAALMAQGVYVPASLAPAEPPGSLNHSDLAALALADWRLEDRLRHQRGITTLDNLVQFRTDTAAAFAAEIAAAPAECDTLLLTSEHCHSRVLLLHEVARLYEFLAPFAVGYEVVVYLRPQHDLAMSQYGMQLLAGETGAEMLPPLPYPADYAMARTTDAAYFDYGRLLSRWAAIFGRAAVRPALFPEVISSNGDVIDDFCSRIGIDCAAMQRPQRLATNVSAPAQRFLREFLPIAAARLGERAESVIGFVALRLRRSNPGHGELPPRDAVGRFLTQFAASNERVRIEWFAERGRLFDIDLAGFPPASEAPPLEADEVMAQLVDLLAATQ